METHGYLGNGAGGSRLGGMTVTVVDRYECYREVAVFRSERMRSGSRERRFSMARLRARRLANVLNQ